MESALSVSRAENDSIVGDAERTRKNGLNLNMVCSAVPIIEADILAKT